MPFGEELSSGSPNRSSYPSPTDNLRKRFTGYEKDAETGLDFAEARYYNNNHGRFTAVDPLLTSGESSNPQTFNRYVYVGNNPLIRIDPTGEVWYVTYQMRRYKGHKIEVMVPKWYREANKSGYKRWTEFTYTTYQGKAIALDPYNNRSVVANSFQDAREQFLMFRLDALWNAGIGFSKETATPPVSAAIDSFVPHDKESDTTLSGQRMGMLVNAFSGMMLGELGALDEAAATINTASKIPKVVAAEEKIPTIGSGPFAYESIPARGAGRINTLEQAEINRIGEAYGCHSCGTMNPGTKSGNWIGDHQTPSALVEAGTPQRLYPQCIDCSRSQGGIVTSIIKSRKNQ